MDKLFINGKSFIKNGCSLFIEHFRYHWAGELKFDYKSVLGNFFLSAYRFRDDRLFIREKDQKPKFDGITGNGTDTSGFYFVTPKCLHYMQYYMMLVEKCDHVVVKVVTTVTGLDEQHIYVFK